MSKIKILFDAKILNNYFKNGSSRSGIFFTSYNLLKEFIKNENLEITLYFDNMDLPYESLHKLLQDDANKVKIAGLGKFHYIMKYLKSQCDKSKKNNGNSLIRTSMKIILSLFKKFNELLIFLDSDLGYDVYFSPHCSIPNSIKSKKSIKKYTIIYDVIPLLYKEYFEISKSGHHWLPKLVKSMNNNEHYFSISECTKKDFLKYRPDLYENNISVSLLACDEKFKPNNENLEKVLGKYNIPQDKKYIFSLCTIEPRKNLIRAVKTFIDFIKKNNIDDMVFVLGGAHWNVFIDSFQNELSDISEYQDKIIRAGYVDDEDLPVLYSNALWFVYTSQYEGFGLPVLEAMSCGTPVITSNNSSLPEVVGDCAIMINYDSDEEHVKAYEKYYYDSEFRKYMAKKGFERSEVFSWNKCANIMINKIINDYKERIN